jgi:hypothetical protein
MEEIKRRWESTICVEYGVASSFSNVLVPAGEEGVSRTRSGVRIQFQSLTCALMSPDALLNFTQNGFCSISLFMDARKAT